MVLPSQYGDLQTKIEMSAKCLSNGGVAAVPTDTLYAFAASVFIERSVERIFELKGRPDNQGMPVLLDGIDRMNSCVLDIPELALPLMDVFWPGPLTIVLRRSPAVPSVVCGGLETVGIRVPDHELTRGIVKELDAPITGTSVNRSDSESLNSAELIANEFGDQIDLIVDSCTGAGKASTVIDMTGVVPLVLREGAVNIDEIRDVIGVEIAWNH